MALFRKKETYNEQMLREAGLNRVVFNLPEPTPEPEPAAVPAPASSESFLARHGSVGPKDWDAVTTVEAPGIRDDRVDFTTLPNGDVIVTSDGGEGDLSPLADAIEEHVSPPYKAAASRQDGDLWGVGAKRIEVAEFEFAGADTLELARSGGAPELDVNGEPSEAVPPAELQRLGERIGGDFCVEAARIDGDYWEVKVSRL